MAADSNNNNDGGGNTGNNNDMVKQLFNADGSLRDARTVTEARVRRVTLRDDAENFSAVAAMAAKAMAGEEMAAASPSPSFKAPSPWMAVDGKRVAGAAAGSSSSAPQQQQQQSQSDATSRTGAVTITYDLPANWNDQYVDTTTTVASVSTNGGNGRGCGRITVYRAPTDVGTAHTTATAGGADRLATATRVGIATALDVPGALRAALTSADVIGGRTTRRSSDNNKSSNKSNDQVYYEFDMALAPAECSGGEADDLRLGFCPYDRVYLLTATRLDDGRLYAMCIEADRSEWKRANAELRRVRSSFRVRTDDDDGAAAAA